MDTRPVNTLSKEERLSGKAAIGALTSKGRWGHLGHFKYCTLDNGLEINRIMVSVPKRNFKRAVRRNLLKRRIREAYRTQKSLLAGGSDILFFYNSQEICDSDVIRAEVGEILTRLR
ncbi:MAG: ribonuclease P protein component [Bacteroidales bacterium]|nr:ribonuclease P protein component [Bacteroidales bacterium]